MGTTGMYGFKKNGKYKMTYNHNDSYLNWLGSNIVDFIKSTSVKEMNDIFDKIIVVSRLSHAPDKYIDKYERLEYGCGDTWNNLIMETEGDLNYYKKDLIHMMVDDEYCDKNGLDNFSVDEWAYIINLDTNKLEVYCDDSQLLEEDEIKQVFEKIFNIKPDRCGDYLLANLSFENIEQQFNDLLGKYNDFEKKRDEIEGYDE